MRYVSRPHILKAYNFNLSLQLVFKSRCRQLRSNIFGVVCVFVLFLFINKFFFLHLILFSFDIIIFRINGTKKKTDFSIIFILLIFVFFFLNIILMVFDHLNVFLFENENDKTFLFVNLRIFFDHSVTRYREKKREKKKPFQLR